MRIYFQAVTDPEKLAAASDFGRWHVLHGWAYNVWDCSLDGSSGRVIGMFYVTNLAGLAGVLHFESVVPDIPPAHSLAAFRKGVALADGEFDTVLATIPESKQKLLAVVRRMGFRDVPFSFNSKERHRLLQYFPR